MKVVYLAGPYRASTVRGITENIRSAEQVALFLWEMGLAVICPHKNTALLDGALPDIVFLEGDKAILAKCDAVVLMPTWERSDGALAEAALARSLGLPVFRWPQDNLQLREFRDS